MLARADQLQLIAAAHAGCFSMALSGQLANAGMVAEAIDTSATVNRVPIIETSRTALFALETLSWDATVEGLLTSYSSALAAPRDALGRVG